MNMEGKICNICHQYKTIDEFSINRKARDGRAYRCKPCHNVYNRRIMQLHREKKRKYEQEWRKKKTQENADVSHISFKSFDFTRDYSNTQKFLQKMGYDITQDIHEQFLKRVLIAFGKVLPPKDRPKDRLTKYWE